MDLTEITEDEILFPKIFYLFRGAVLAIFRGGGGRMIKGLWPKTRSKLDWIFRMLRDPASVIDPHPPEGITKRMWSILVVMKEIDPILSMGLEVGKRIDDWNILIFGDMEVKKISERTLRTSKTRALISSNPIWKIVVSELKPKSFSSLDGVVHKEGLASVMEVGPKGEEKVWDKPKNYLGRNCRQR